MDPVLARRLAVPVALLVFLVVEMLLPSLRVSRRTGRSALVFHRAADPFQRTIGVAFTACIVGYSAWALLYGALGAGALGVWTVPATVEGAGWTLVAGGFALVLVAQQQMGESWRIGIDDRPTSLVTAGVFALSRNPIFSALMLLLAGLTLVTPSPWTIMGWFSTALLVVLQVRLEEAHLLKLHGDAYRAYASRVGRFLPAIGRLPAVPGR